MTVPRVVPGTRFRAWLPAALVVLAIVTGCSPGSTGSPSSPTSSASSSSVPSAAASPAPPGSETLVIVGRIVTMDQPPIAEDLLIENGTVAAVGIRDEVLALAGDQVPVVDIGSEGLQ